MRQSINIILFKILGQRWVDFVAINQSICSSVTTKKYQGNGRESMSITFDLNSKSEKMTIFSSTFIEMCQILVSVDNLSTTVY